MLCLSAIATIASKSATSMLGLVILSKRAFYWSSGIKDNPWPMLLIGYMLVSILWSDIPFISFKRWVRELVAVVMAFMVATEPDPRKALESLFRRTIYILIPFSVLLIKYYPHFGVDYNWSGAMMWIGVTLQKNGLGRLCLVAAFFLFWSLVRRSQGHDISGSRYQSHFEIFVLIITLWLLKGPPGVYPATATIALTAGIASFIGLLWIKRLQIRLGANVLATIIALIIGFGIVTVVAGGSTVSGLAPSLGREGTLTGRTEIWASLLPVLMQRPIAGSGFGSFWTTTNRQIHNIVESHSGYLDVLLELGCIGLLLASMFLMSSIRKAQKVLAYDYDWGSLWICYLIMAVIFNISESSLCSFTNHLMTILLFLAVSSTADNSYTSVVSREV